MKTKVVILALALSASTCLLTAQDGNPPRDGQRPPPREGGRERGGDRPGPAETLTDAQKAQVKAILSKFDANALTAETAKAIHEAFRQAGLRGGPAMADTIKAAGFDPGQTARSRAAAGTGQWRERASAAARRRSGAQGGERPSASRKAGSRAGKAATRSSRRSRIGRS